MNEEAKKIHARLNANVDNGRQPQSRPMTDEERKLASLSMACNAAVLQFVAEGIIPDSEQGHFMMHLQDFAARLYAGEDLKFGTGDDVNLTNGETTVKQTFNVDSRLGEVYLAAANLGIKSGRVPRDADNKNGEKHVNKTLN